MTYDHLTIMYALPRSMTQWWRWFFAHGCHSIHDPLARRRHPDELKAFVDSLCREPAFIVDTSALYFHRRLQKLLPGHRRLYMLRNPADCLASARRQGYTFDAAEMADLMRTYAWAEDNNQRLHYGCLSADTLASVFTQVTGKPPMDGAKLLDNRIDTLLRMQRRNPDILKYKDPP